VVDCKGMTVTPSFVDLHAHLCDPGTEHRENLNSGRNCARESGFTHVAVLPETTPVLENKESIRYILSENHLHAVELQPLGAATEGLDGENLTQMYDLSEAGAAGFTDGNKPITDGGALIRALRYVKTFGKPILNTPNDPTIDRFGVVHEGRIHLETGLKGRPALAEELAVPEPTRASRDGTI
jgi:dihydroorotase